MHYPAVMKAKTVFPGDSRHDNAVRVLAILLAILVIGLALFSKVFRFGRDCQRTIGQTSPMGQVSSFVIGLRPGACEWHTGLIGASRKLRDSGAGQS
jgi:hypothetical protein